MRYKVLLSATAKADSKRIHEYILHRFGKKAAAKFKLGFRNLIKTLRQTPRMYEMVPEAPGVHKCAALAPTLVLYQLDDLEKRVEILTLYDGRHAHD